MMCAGEFDLVATVRCHDMAEFRGTLLVRLHAIDDVVGSETAFVLDEVRNPLRPGREPAGGGRGEGLPPIPWGGMVEGMEIDRSVLQEARR